MEDDDWSPKSPKKKKKKKDSGDCLIHYDEISTKESLSEFSEVSWQTVTRSATIRQDDSILSLEDYSLDEYSKLQFHRKCYQRYTNKKSLERFTTVQKPTTSATSRIKRNLSKKEALIADQTICLICNQKSKTSSSGSGYEKLSKCLTMAGAKSLLAAAALNDDNRILTELSGKDESSVVAYEVMYHRSCFRMYTKKSITGNENAKEEAWIELEEYIHNSLILGGEIVWMRDLANVYSRILKEVKLPSMGANTKDLKSKLKDKMNDTLEFHSILGRGDLVYAKFNTGQLLEKFHKTPREKIDECVSILQTEIESQKSIFENWPTPEEEVRNSNIVIPPLLSRFIKGLLSKNKEGEKTKLVCESICQDILYNVSSHRIKTVKHLQLGLYLKRKTGSKEIISLLNRMGHCVSYPQINMHETYFASLQSENQSCRSFVPKCIQPSLFVTFVYDNGDHNPESIFGSSFHCTNGIAIQKISPQITLRSTTTLPKVSNPRRTSFKPLNLEMDPCIVKEKPQPSSFLIERELSAFDELVSKSDDLIWILSSYNQSQMQVEQNIPGWTGFHHLTGPPIDDLDISQVAYLPSINCPPTDSRAVNEVLKQVKSKSDHLLLEHSDLVLDHAIYSKALQIMLSPTNEHLNKTILIRMGGFHTECIFLAVIGKRFKDAGLKDLAIESEILGPSSVESAFKGKAYNYAMRMHKFLFSAFWRQKIDEICKNIAHCKIVDSFMQSNQFKSLINEDLSQQKLIKCRETFNRCYDVIKEFEDTIKDTEKYGPSAAFWDSYLTMVQILLDFNKSLRRGNWDLHLQSMQRMLPWFFAYDRQNYSRHLTYCWSTLTRLEDTHPVLYDEFRRGNFSVRRIPGRFNKLPPDQIIEQTINKDQKGTGGIKGFSTTEGTVQRWILSSNSVSSIMADLSKSYLSGGTSESQPKDLSKKRIMFDDRKVSKCYDILTSWGNPFKHSVCLSNLSSGLTAPDKATEDLLSAEQKGQKQLHNFLVNRVESSKIAFYAPIKKLQLETFSSLQKRKKVKVNDQTIAIKSDRQTFVRMLMVQQRRNIDIKQVLKYELGSVPHAISNSDGSLRKSVKSKLMDSLEKGIPIVDSIPANTTFIFDGMVLLQKLPPKLKTFGEVSDYILQKIVKERNSGRLVFFVTDQYFNNSIKILERQRRGRNDSIKINISRRDQAIPLQFEKFLRCPENKGQLVKFLVDDWSTNQAHVSLISNKDVFITYRSSCKKITTDGEHLFSTEISCLASNQEEADTKMFLCIQYANSLGVESFCIDTVDSDVGILALYYSTVLEGNIYLRLGKKSKTRVLDISNSTIEHETKKALPGLHALTGCDTTSSFYGKGKVKALTTMSKKTSHIQAMKELGEGVDIDDIAADLEHFVCCIYGFPASYDINEVRYLMFKNVKKTPDPQSLPPTKDSLYLHISRVNYQVRIWKQALDTTIVQLSPTEHGWTDEDGSLNIKWMNILPAPDSILEFVACGCRKECGNNRCGCHSNKLNCTDACRCKCMENNESEAEDSEEEYGDFEDILNTSDEDDDE